MVPSLLLESTWNVQGFFVDMQGGRWVLENKINLATWLVEIDHFLSVSYVTHQLISFNYDGLRQ